MTEQEAESFVELLYAGYNATLELWRRTQDDEPMRTYYAGKLESFSNMAKHMLSGDDGPATVEHADRLITFSKHVKANRRMVVKDAPQCSQCSSLTYLRCEVCGLPVCPVHGESLPVTYNFVHQTCKHAA